MFQYFIKFITLFGLHALLAANANANIDYNCNLKAASDLDPIESIERSENAELEFFVERDETLWVRSIFQFEVSIEHKKQNGDEFLLVEVSDLLSSYKSEISLLIRSNFSTEYARHVNHRFGYANSLTPYTSGLITCNRKL
jgi:hypothetical protein